MTWVTFVVLAAVMMLAGCGGDERGPEAAPTPRYRIPTSTPTPVPAPATTFDPNAPVHLGYGVDLEPGANGKLPVSVRWTYQGVYPEEFAVDLPHHLVYLDDEGGTALDLETGDVVWDSYPDNHGEGLNSDGGDVIGRDGSRGIRFFAPYNYDYTVDRTSGEVIAKEFRTVRDAHRGLVPFPRPRPRAYRVSVGLDQVVARSRAGRALWRISVLEPEYDSRGPIAVPGGVAVLLATGLLVVLDDRHG